MKSICVFSNKGGTGRTTLVMALASGFIAFGKRVLVIDTTSEAEPLASWTKAVRATGMGVQSLALETIGSDFALEDALERGSEEGFDVCVIDTPPSPEDVHLHALHTSDLVLAPFSGSFEARIVARRLAEYLTPELKGKVRGVFVKARRTPRDAFQDANTARHLFNIAPMLKSEFPHGELSNRIYKQGLLPSDQNDPDVLAISVLIDELDQTLEIICTSAVPDECDVA